MTRTRSLFSLVVALASSACASSGTPTPTQGSGPASSPAEARTPSQREPVAAPPDAASFTVAQADRGRDTFRGVCTECHYSSEFADAQFKFKWSRRSAGSLYQLISTTMPETAPGSLSPSESVALVAYILRMNGFDPGPTELAADRDVLDQISLTSIR